MGEAEIRQRHGGPVYRRAIKDGKRLAIVGECVERAVNQRFEAADAVERARTGRGAAGGRHVEAPFASNLAGAS